MVKKHRNNQRRIYLEDVAYFITSNTKNWAPYFKESIFCELFVENLKLCKKLKSFYLYGWFLGYNYFHLLVRLGQEFDYSNIMFSIKKQFSYNINVVLGYNKPYNPPEGAQSIARLQGGCGDSGNSELIEMIKKFDQFILKLKNQFHQKYPNGTPYPKFKWAKSFHDHYIRNHGDFEWHMGYIAWNPEKHNIPDDWLYVFTNPEYKNLTDECI